MPSQEIKRLLKRKVVRVHVAMQQVEEHKCIRSFIMAKARHAKAMIADKV